jgi:hypothetical protein
MIMGFYTSLAKVIRLDDVAKRIAADNLPAGESREQFRKLAGVSK